MKVASELRRRLIEQLGGKCVSCGATAHLQFDCIVSTGPKHHGMNSADRARYYADQAAKKNVQLLCPKCHVQKTLDEIAARRYHEWRATCPQCKHVFRVGDQMRSRHPLPEAGSGVVADQVQESGLGS